MAAELTVSTYHIRIGVQQLLERGEITIEERGMGRTDIIRLTDRSLGIPAPPTVEFTEPEFELPPEPELPEEPQLPVQPVEVEIEPVVEPIEVVVEEPIEVATEPVEIEPVVESIEIVVEEPAVEPVEEPVEVEKSPAETEFQPVELGVQNFSPPSSKILNYKYISSEEDKKKYTHTPTELGTTEEPPKAPKKQCDEEKELISFYYETKENRQPSRNEIYNWRKTARRLLDEFTLDELKPAVINAIDKGALLFHFVALTAPDFILKQRQQKQDDAEREKRASKALQAERKRIHQLEALRRSAAVYDAQTKDLLTGLESKMRPQIFRTWFADSFITEITKDSLTLAVASQGAAEWISKSYTTLIQEITGKAHIEFVAG